MPHSAACCMGKRAVLPTAPDGGRGFSSNWSCFSLLPWGNGDLPLTVEPVQLHFKEGLGLQRDNTPYGFALTVQMRETQSPSFPKRRTVSTSSSPTAAELPGLQLGPGRQGDGGLRWWEGYRGNLLKMRSMAFRMQIFRKSEIHWFSACRKLSGVVLTEFSHLERSLSFCQEKVVKTLKRLGNGG